MGYTKNTWTDKNVQFPNRYTDELSNVKTFTPSPGIVTNAGTLVTASYMNNIENGVDMVHKGTHVYGVSAIGTDAYAITFSPAYAAYTTGMIINLKVDVANTGAATINVDSLGVKTIKKNVSSDVATGDIVAGQIATLIYDGTNFQLLNPNSINSGLLTAQGDMLYASGANTAAKLAKGLYLQGLQINSAETAPEWGNVMTGNKQIVTTTGATTFTAPKTGIYKVTVVGGGGGRGTGSGTAGGGGAGATAIKFISLTKNDTVTVTIGTGGALGGTNALGGTGGTSSFGTHCSATGGTGGNYTAGPTAIGGAGTGGTASNGDINIRGGDGGEGLVSGGTLTYIGIGGVSSFGGIGAYGAGGGGANGLYDGKQGVCIVEW